MANRIRQMVKKQNTKSDEIKDNNIICNEIYRKDIIQVDLATKKWSFSTKFGEKLEILKSSTSIQQMISLK